MLFNNTQLDSAYATYNQNQFIQFSLSNNQKYSFLDTQGQTLYVTSDLVALFRLKVTTYDPETEVVLTYDSTLDQSRTIKTISFEKMHQNSSPLPFDFLFNGWCFS